jgi:uncharacterized protein (AIM24 family)
MSVVIDGITGVTAAAFDGALDGADLTGSVAASLLTGDVAAARIASALNATGSAPIFACRAWVNFNGTGTVAIRASGNVSSITDNGTGDYTVNFTTAMQDANYAVIRSIDYDSTAGGSATNNTEVLSAATGSVRVVSETYNGSRFDVLRYEIAIFR